MGEAGLRAQQHDAALTVENKHGMDAGIPRISNNVVANSADRTNAGWSETRQPWGQPVRRLAGWTVILEAERGIWPGNSTESPFKSYQDQYNDNLGKGDTRGHRLLRTTSCHESPTTTRIARRGVET